MWLFQLLSSCVCLQAVTSAWEEVWVEEFNGNTLNKTTWVPEVNCIGGGNNELQCYTDRAENVKVNNGFLVITAKPENYLNRNYTSGRIKQRSNGFLYGKMEASIKLPKGKHLWPAFWMMPQDNAYGGWPTSGEIDILEFRGQRLSMIEGTLHYGGKWPNNKLNGSGPVDFKQDLTRAFHNYSIEWSPKEISWFLDKKLYYRQSLRKSFHSGNGTDPYNGKQGSPFDRRFQFIINLAVGGNFFPEKVYGTLSLNEAKHWPQPQLVVDWVRVYKQNIR